MQFLSVDSHAVGFIAIGGQARGVIAIGQSAEGVIAIGQLALGVVAVGQLARGVIVVGQLGVGCWVWGQLSLGLVRAVGMGAVAARARGMLPLSFWPELEGRTRAEHELVAFGELASGARSVGWVDARIERDGDRVQLVIDGVARPEVALADTVIDQATLRGTSPVKALIRATEVLSPADEGGFRDAPTRTVELAASEVEWPPRWTSSQRFVLAACLLVMVPLLGWAVAWPLAQSLIALAGS